MGKVIGPVEASRQDRYLDWYTMRELRSSIKWSKETDSKKYAGAIKGFKEAYDGHLKRYASAVSY